MELPFVTVDVFTRTRYRGNPLAIVTIPPSASLTYTQKLAVAREFNLSETVFIHDVTPEEDERAVAEGKGDAAAAERSIDIFLTSREIPFAGHPTIGAAVTLLGKGVRRLVAKAGPVDVEKMADDAVRAAIPHNVHLHANKPQDLAIPAAGSLMFSQDVQLQPAELAAPVCAIVRGMNFILVELPSLEHLAKAEMHSAKIPSQGLLDEEWNTGFLGWYYFVRTGADGDTVKIRTRMLGDNLEDPATGSAASCLAAYLSLHVDGRAESSVKYEITQGVEMGKESNIQVDVAVKDSKIQTVHLSGAAVPVMRGFITV